MCSLCVCLSVSPAAATIWGIQMLLRRVVCIVGHKKCVCFCFTHTSKCVCMRASKPACNKACATKVMAFCLCSSLAHAGYSQYRITTSRAPVLSYCFVLQSAASRLQLHCALLLSKALQQHQAHTQLRCCIHAMLLWRTAHELPRTACRVCVCLLGLNSTMVCAICTLPTL